MKLFHWLNPEDWKRAIALIIVWAYGYQLVVWPLASWAMLLVSKWSGTDWPVPMIVPWEQLVAGTATLAAVGGIERWRDSISARSSHDS